MKALGSTRSFIVLAFLFPTTSCLHAQFGPGEGYANVPQDAYSVIAEVHAKPGKATQLRAISLRLMTPVRGDQKTLDYFLQEDRERPGHMVFYEVFATKDDFEAHNRQPYVQDWLAKLSELTTGGVRITRLSVQTRSADMETR